MQKPPNNTRSSGASNLSPTASRASRDTPQDAGPTPLGSDRKDSSLLGASQNENGQPLNDEGQSVSTGSLPPTDIRRVDVPASHSSLQLPQSAERVHVRDGGQTRQEDRSMIRGRLDILGDTGIEKTIFLDGNEITVGRARDMDIVALEEGISRAHAVFQRHDQGYRIRDTGSGNGTYLNGRSIDVAELYDHDVVTIGRLQLRYHTLGWTRPRRRKRSAVALTFTESLAVETNRSPLVNLLAGFTSAVVGVLLASLLSQNQMADVNRTADYWFEKAQMSEKAEKWEDAAEELEVARVLGLNSKAYKSMAPKLQQAVIDQRIMDQLVQAAESGLSWVQIEKLASRINPSSPYSPRAKVLLADMEKIFVSRWSREANRAYMSGNLKKLKQALGHIRKADGEHPTLKQLSRHLNQ